jgi:plastocyanin
MMHTTNAVVLAAVLALVGGCAAGDSGEEMGGRGPGILGAGGGGGADAASEDEAHDATGVVNGCTRAHARDETGHSAVTIHFPSPATSLRYSPACVRVSKGTHVTWAGDFAAHPLQAGRVNPTTEHATVSTTSPIHQRKSGTRATFEFSGAGTFGYYCERHYKLGMKGAVFVE